MIAIPHPRKIDWFRRNRKEQYECALKIRDSFENGYKFILCCAPFKSGKREIVEIISLHGKGEPSEKHYFITSLNRKDIKVQIDELKSYGLEVVILIGKELRDLKTKLQNSKDFGKIFIHFDESDFGTGGSQNFAEIYKIIKQNDIKLIGYSATNEEALFVEETKDFVRKALPIPFTPHKDYRGADFFLKNNLVFEAEPFFLDGKLTEQAYEAINYWLTTDKPLAIVRLPGEEKENKKNGPSRPGTSLKDFDNKIIGSELRKHGIEIIVITGESNLAKPFDWTDSQEFVEKYKEYNKQRHLLVINQTCTRSTEVKFVENVAFLHDYRFSDSSYNTMGQAMVRLAHYHPVGHHIRHYVRKEVFQLAAGVIEPEQYSGKLSSRINKNFVQKRGTRISKNPNDYEYSWKKIGNVKITAEELKKELTLLKNEVETNLQNKTGNKLKLGNVDIESLEWDSINNCWKQYNFIAGQRNKIILEELINDPTKGLNKGNTTTRPYVCYDKDNELCIFVVIHNGNKQIIADDIFAHETKSGKNGSAYCNE